MPAGSRGGQQAAAVPGRLSPLSSTGQGLLPWPRERSPGCRSQPVALVWGQHWDGDSLERLSCSPAQDELSAAVPKLLAVLQGAPSHQDGMAPQLGPSRDRDRALHAPCSHPLILHTGCMGLTLTLGLAQAEGYVSERGN